MQRILSGIETEYGLSIEGRGAQDQVDDATAFVRSYPGPNYAGWDYRYESPRSDLRGFKVSHLQFDPDDAAYDKGKVRGRDADIRSDRILPNGARFYNDHGHPEYATPECWGLRELSYHDKAGELALLRASNAYAAAVGLSVSVYKNNTDYHGASYGTHESYLVPRALGFERLYKAVMPMLVCRQVLTGAGKVGAETGNSAIYQISQRADFFVEPFNTETLYRRPIFNTRDEPHGDPRDWIRMHVISGDANMISSCTSRKVGLVKLAVLLESLDESPLWRFRNPVNAFQSISRDERYDFRIELEGDSWTDARHVLESYFSAAERVLGIKADLDGDEGEFHRLICECRSLLQDLKECPERFSRHVDWAAKKAMLEHYMEEEGTDWTDPSLHAFDLEYHNIDPEQGLFYALQAMDRVEAEPNEQELEPYLESNFEETRALARGVAVSKFSSSLVGASWRSIALRLGDQVIEVPLEPDRRYPAQLAQAENVGTFIKWIQEVNSGEAKID